MKGCATIPYAYVGRRSHRLTVPQGARPLSIASYIRTIPDYPVEGVLFRDVTGLLEDARGLRIAVDTIVQRYVGEGLDFVAGIEARGFIFGTAVAYQLGVGFIPLRKAGKLPGAVVGVDYELEYGSDRLEMHRDAIPAGSSVLVVDDLIATGGTALAGIELVRSVGGVVDECCFVIELPELGGRTRLAAVGAATFALCTFEGH
jgi:adenine phosphoribosyltransferase